MSQDPITSKDRAPTTWYADNHLEEVDDAWTMDDPDDYREAMRVPWRPQSQRLSEAERAAQAASPVQVEEDDFEELTEAEITEVEGFAVDDIFGEDDSADVLQADSASTDSAMSDEDISSVVSALAAELRSATTAPADPRLSGDPRVGVDPQGQLVHLDDLDFVDDAGIDELPGDALAPADASHADQEITDLDAPLVLVPGYSVQCEAPPALPAQEPAANGGPREMLDRATPARIARRLWQRDIDRVAS